MNSLQMVRLQCSVHYCGSLRGYIVFHHQGNLREISRMEIRDVRCKFKLHQEKKKKIALLEEATSLVK